MELTGIAPIYLVLRKSSSNGLMKAYLPRYTVVSLRLSHQMTDVQSFVLGQQYLLGH